MTLFRWLVLGASLLFAASYPLAQKPEEPQKPAAAEPAKAGKAPEPRPVIEISRSTQSDCDVKPVMTDDEIARCRRASRKIGTDPIFR